MPELSCNPENPPYETVEPETDIVPSVLFACLSSIKAPSSDSLCIAKGASPLTVKNPFPLAPFKRTPVLVES